MSRRCELPRISICFASVCEPSIGGLPNLESRHRDSLTWGRRASASSSPGRSPCKSRQWLHWRASVSCSSYAFQRRYPWGGGGCSRLPPFPQCGVLRLVGAVEAGSHSARVWFALPSLRRPLMHVIFLSGWCKTGPLKNSIFNPQKVSLELRCVVSRAILCCSCNV